MKFSFTYNKKKTEINVKHCKNFFQKAIGLMFKRNSPPLLFTFRRPTKASIHSFFCQPFIAVWFNNNNIVDIKLIKPWHLSVKPDSRFDKLLEIPSNDKHFKALLDERKV
jgi:uncharacterized membrane protein (UPF0127 family)